jgi:hypothetical protein
VIVHAIALVLEPITILTMAEIWDLFEHRRLFRARNPERKLDDG